MDASKEWKEAVFGEWSSSSSSSGDEKGGLIGGAVVLKEGGGRQREQHESPHWRDRVRHSFFSLLVNRASLISMSKFEASPRQYRQMTI